MNKANSPPMQFQALGLLIAVGQALNRPSEEWGGHPAHPELRLIDWNTGASPETQRLRRQRTPNAAKIGIGDGRRERLLERQGEGNFALQKLTGVPRDGRRRIIA